MSLMTDRYAEEHPLARLASSVGMSPFHFCRVFRQLVGTPPHRYLMEVRLERARTFLLDGRSVTDACFESGFWNLSHFIRLFARRFGCVPSMLRRTLQ